MAFDAHFGVRAYARWVTATKVDVHVEGLHNIPTSGPTLIVARHYHHLYDGAALVARIGRPVRIFVALDWIANANTRRWMERLCSLAGFPVALRADGFRSGATTAFSRRETIAYLRAALERSTQLLRAGEVVAIFPEGYPNVDPTTNRKAPNEWLPFAPGFMKMLELAQRDGTRVAVVPVGFSYTFREHARDAGIMRIGAPEFFERGTARSEIAAVLERQVRELS